MAVTVDFVAKHGRIDEDIASDPQERAYIEELIQIATAYIEEQTGKVADEDMRVYKLCIVSMVVYWYENRDALSFKTNVHDLPFQLQAMINHISLCGKYRKGDLNA